MARTRKTRTFEVRTPCGGRAMSHVVAGESLEGAALAFIAEVGLTPHADEHQASVYVRDLDGGQEHCFLIDLDTGEAKPCK